MRLNQLFNKPMAISVDAASQLTSLFLQVRSSVSPDVAMGAAIDGASLHGDGVDSDGVQVIPVRGVVVPRGSGGWFQTVTSCQSVAGRLREALANSRVERIVLDIDSPGGDVMGVVELANEIYAARGQKRIVAVANGLMASAAYWIGSAADEVVITPSGLAGSVGVVAVHFDHSAMLAEAGITPSLIYAGRHKVEGNPYEPLGDEARGQIQSEVDRYHEMFITAVALHRGVSASVVRDEFGGGRTFGASAAVQLGMADRVGTLDDVIFSANHGRRRGSRRAGLSTRQRRLRLAEIA